MRENIATKGISETGNPSLTALLAQRSTGRLDLSYSAKGVQVLREAGSAKLRLPRSCNEAVMINTSGGLAGGDQLDVSVEIGAGANLTITSQAAERVYRSLHPAAEISTSIKLGPKACLNWLPQETILFDGAKLRRQYRVKLADHARFLSLEALVFGRRERGEVIASLELHDRWQIERQGQLIHAEQLHFAETLPQTRAGLNKAGAIATLMFFADEISDDLCHRANAILGEQGAASCWNGKLVARLMARDGFELRKSLSLLLPYFLTGQQLPKLWSF